jgi:hypothetical protein
MRVSISQRLVVSLLHGTNYDRMESDMIMQTRETTPAYTAIACADFMLSVNNRKFTGDFSAVG